MRVAHVQPRCHEGVHEALGGVLRQQGMDAANIAEADEQILLT